MFGLLSFGLFFRGESRCFPVRGWRGPGARGEARARQEQERGAPGSGEARAAPGADL